MTIDQDGDPRRANASGPTDRLRSTRCACATARRGRRQPSRHRLASAAGPWSRRIASAVADLARHLAQRARHRGHARARAAHDIRGARSGAVMRQLVDATIALDDPRARFREVALGRARPRQRGDPRVRLDRATRQDVAARRVRRTARPRAPVARATGRRRRRRTRCARPSGGSDAGSARRARSARNVDQRVRVLGPGRGVACRRRRPSGVDVRGTAASSASFHAARRRVPREERRAIDARRAARESAPSDDATIGRPVASAAVSVYDQRLRDTARGTSRRRRLGRDEAVERGIVVLAGQREASRVERRRRRLDRTEDAEDERQVAPHRVAAQP